MSLPISFQGLDPDGYKHYLHAHKVSEGYQFTNPGEWDPEHLIYQWSIAKTGFYWNCSYQKNTFSVARGVARACPAEWTTLFAGESIYPEAIEVIFYDPARPLYDKGVWGYPYKPEHVIAAKMNSCLDMSGTERVVRTYGAAYPANPADYSDVTSDPTTEAAVGLLGFGVKMTPGGGRQYIKLDVDLPINLEADGINRVVDVTELFKWRFGNRGIGAFTVMPNIESITLDPSIAPGPEFMWQIAQVLVPNTSGMPIHPSSPDTWNYTTPFTYDSYEWGIPILGLSNGRMTVYHPNPPANMRTNPFVIPGGVE